MGRGMSGPDEMDYESYELTNMLKSFLLGMPEPLLKLHRYDDFLRRADLPNGNDRVQTLLSIMKILPAHPYLLERLIFHQALVVKLEQYNRMSTS